MTKYFRKTGTGSLPDMYNMRIIIRTGALETLHCTAVKALPHAGNVSAAQQETPYHRTEKALRMSGKAFFIIR